MRRVVKAVLINRSEPKDTFLITRVSDIWTLPGGGIEGNETRTEALVREMHEELGLDLSYHMMQPVGTDVFTLISNGVDCLAFYYLVYWPEDQEIILGDGQKEYRWVTLDSLPETGTIAPEIYHGIELVKEF